MATIKYYSVTCHRGHCGTKQSSDITFVFESLNMLAAMDMAKRMPGVKHSRMIVGAKEITKEEYLEYRQISAYDRRPMGKWGR